MTLVCPVCGQTLSSAEVRIIAATCDGAGKHKPRAMIERGENVAEERAS